MQEEAKVGVNDAFCILKKRLDLSGNHSFFPGQDHKGFYGMEGSNQYFRFMPVSAFLDSKTEFSLYTGVRGSYRFSELFEIMDMGGYDGVADDLGLIEYLRKYKQSELKRIKKGWEALQNNARGALEPFKEESAAIPYHWYLKSKTLLRLRKEVQKKAEGIALKPYNQQVAILSESMTQKVNIGTGDSKVSIRHTTEICRFMINEPREFREELYVPEISESASVFTSELRARVPCEIDDKNHPLLLPILKKARSVTLSIPADEPSLIVTIKDASRDPQYEIRVKEGGVDKKTMDDMIGLLLE